MWRKYDVTVTFLTLMIWRQCLLHCMARLGAVADLTNGQHACVLVFVLMVDILNIPCDCQFVLCVLDELYVSHHAWCSILRMHYKSTRCDVSFSQGSVSTLFRWTCLHVCVKMFFLLTAVQKLQELISRWDSERERFYDDISHVEASAYAHWTASDSLFRDIWRQLKKFMLIDWLIDW